MNYITQISEFFNRYSTDDKIVALLLLLCLIVGIIFIYRLIKFMINTQTTISTPPKEKEVIMEERQIPREHVEEVLKLWDDCCSDEKELPLYLFNWKIQSIFPTINVKEWEFNPDHCGCNPFIYRNSK